MYILYKHSVFKFSTNGNLTMQIILGGKKKLLTHDFELQHIGLSVALKVGGYTRVASCLSSLNGLQDQTRTRNDDPRTFVMQNHHVLKLN